MDTQRTIAAFDFDGTITYRDSLLPFLIFTNGYCKTFGKLLLLTPTFIRFLLKTVTRQQVKEAIISSFFKGETLESIEKKGREFAAKKLNKCIRPKARERIEWHQKMGHHCILVSASLDVYLAPWAKAAGFKNLLCSSLEVSHDLRVTGKLNGSNCWGPEKAHRLKSLCGPKEEYLLYAYGDSRGDRELLDMADHSFFKTMG